MIRPDIRVTPEGVAAYSEMFGIGVPIEDFEAMSDDLSVALDGIQQLWDFDVSGHEMSVIFPVER